MLNKILLLFVLLTLTGCATQCPTCIQCAACTCPTQTTTIASDRLFVDFIDVGQGDATLIRQGTTEMLIDCGKNSAGQTVVDFLKDKKVTSLEYLMITHPDSDHLGGCDDVLKNIEVKSVITNGLTKDTVSYEDVMAQIDTETLITAEPGKAYGIGPATVVILQANNDLADDNENSIVVKLTYGSQSVLFTGDCDNACEDKLMTKDISATILKVSHHGSKYATKINFLEKVKPTVAIISVGDNSYGHPATETLDRLRQESVLVYRTDLDKDITIETDGVSYAVR